MGFSIYSVTVPVLTRMLGNLSAILDKAEAWARGQGLDPDVLVEARLAPDMFPLSRQVQAATDHAKFIAARLAGRTPPAWEDSETTFDELKQRVNKALDYLSGFGEADLVGSETKPVVLKVRGQEVTTTGEAYVLNRALPNFYFHVTTAYDILRHNGAPLGKADFLG